MSRAQRVIADAVAAVIAARVRDHLPGLDDTEVRAIAEGAVADVHREGWHITALPVPAAAPARKRRSR